MFKRKAGAVTKNLKDVPVENAPSRFLVDLTLDDAKALYGVMLEQCRTIKTPTSSPKDCRILECLASSSSSSRDGRWHLERVTCLLVTTNDSSDSHPRWQIRADGRGRSYGTLSVRLSSEGFSSLTKFCKNYSSGQGKIGHHMVAYNADVRRSSVPLPLDLGRGSSVSHLCDVKGCVKQRHLEISSNHVNNMDRQRCLGVTVIHFQGVIVQEMPCIHGRTLDVGSSLEARLEKSCSRVSLVELSQEAGEIVTSVSRSGEEERGA